MERCFDGCNHTNGYVNIPISLLSRFWVDDFDAFLSDIVCFGTATKQLFDISPSGVLEPLSVAVEDNIDVLENYISEWGTMDDFMFSVDYTREVYLDGIDVDEWTRKVKWVGITVCQLCKMITGRNLISKAKRRRWEEAWIIYFGIKSVVGQKEYFQCSWDFILTRAMGFISGDEYSQYKKSCNYEADWTTQFREKRKARDIMIQRLQDDHGVVYATHRPSKGEFIQSPQWSFNKSFTWVKKVHHSKGKKGTL